jgi:D-isomer specific 2-hydroxyacid dehydrogenase, NAD binding domain
MRHDADQSLQQLATAVKGRDHFSKYSALLQVGSEVARRARGLGLTVIAYDPYASEEKARAQVTGRQVVTAAASADCAAVTAAAAQQSTGAAAAYNVMLLSAVLFIVCRV